MEVFSYQQEQVSIVTIAGTDLSDIASVKEQSCIQTGWVGIWLHSA